MDVKSARLSAKEFLNDLPKKYKKLPKKELHVILKNSEYELYKELKKTNESKKVKVVS